MPAFAQKSDMESFLVSCWTERVYVLNPCDEVQASGNRGILEEQDVQRGPKERKHIMEGLRLLRHGSMKKDGLKPDAAFSALNCRFMAF